MVEVVLPEGADDLLIAIVDDLYQGAERVARALVTSGKAGQVLTFLRDVANDPDRYRDPGSPMASTWAIRVAEGDLEPEDSRPLNVATDLDLTIPVEQATPTIGARSDGSAMIYPGRVHALNGESESGKSWIAATVAAQVARTGHGVLVLDWEDEAGSWASRFQAIGHRGDTAGAGVIRHVACRVSFTDQDWIDTAEWVIDQRASLVIVDGVTESLGAYGCDEIKATDVTHWFHKFPNRLAEFGPGVLLIDHLSRTHGGAAEKYAAGNRHKRAAITGAAWTVTLQSTFGVGRKGMSLMTVSKDRPGRIRSESGEDGTSFAEFVLDGLEDGSATASIVKPATGAGFIRPDVQLHSRVTWYVHKNPRCSMDEIIAGVDADAGSIRATRDRLVRLEIVKIEKGPRGAHEHLAEELYDPSTDPGIVDPTDDDNPEPF